MFINKVTIQNFRLFPNSPVFEIDKFNIPNGKNEGSGLTVFVGENGCGKTTVLDAISFPLLAYKAESFALDDFNDPSEKAYINIYSDNDFTYSGTMPKQGFKAKGFIFEAGTRSRENKNYLSSIVVRDQKFIRADGETKPEDGKPDLRTSVNNPWSGPRFNETDILFLDKNRTYQIRSGTYNPTKFDRLMEDFDFQYISKEGSPFDCNEKLTDLSENIENTFLTEALGKFNNISKEKVKLSYLNNWRPHKGAFLSVEKENKQHISLNNLGSGYEMIFSLIFSFYMSKQSKKKLIVMIDEPELHLHPQLQEEFVKLLLEFSKDIQIIISSHSPLLVKQLMYNQNIMAYILKRDTGTVSISEPEEKVLSYISSNEINFIAFGLPTEEYHNELYEELKIKDDNSRTAPLNLKDFDLHFFQTTHSENPLYPYNGTANQVSIHTHLRNQIHHRGSAGTADINKINDSIIKMRTYLST